MAHQQQRRAEAHLRHARFMEAIECHQLAANHLFDALQCTQNPQSVDSINLQRDYHLRRKEIILAKKEQFENYKKAIENQRNRITFCGSDFEVTNDNQSTSLQVAIYRTMEEADSLLGQLFKRSSGGNSDCESLRSFSTTDTDDKVLSIDTLDSSNPSSQPILGSKHPKHENTVIEELRTLNEQLHSLVYKLVTQLDASTTEVDMLKAKIQKLEAKQQTAQTKTSATNSLKVITDSSGGTSPYVFSPCSEFSPDVNDQRSSLPPLAPLEMPAFDFNSFVKNNTYPRHEYQ